jgi:hypothetical protein
MRGDGMPDMARMMGVVDPMARLGAVRRGETACQGDHRYRRRQPVTLAAKFTHFHTRT